MRSWHPSMALPPVWKQQQPRTLTHTNTSTMNITRGHRIRLMLSKSSTPLPNHYALLPRLSGRCYRLAFILHLSCLRLLHLVSVTEPSNSLYKNISIILVLIPGCHGFKRLIRKKLSTSFEDSRMRIKKPVNYIDLWTTGTQRSLNHFDNFLPP
ncbi:hypothetical protein ARMGADRAFT_455974 [Armillaria gallica]|uniref:Uncharacterized protein n=1 Tax=Armillaria gallica TaxID=47427 RepID=A0A2H3D147_ARMGA|nr:hypothetical protein ARMGADRAFT_455974 [Armillaria gallica]